MAIGNVSLSVKFMSETISPQQLQCSYKIIQLYHLISGLIYFSYLFRQSSYLNQSVL